MTTIDRRSGLGGILCGAVAATAGSNISHRNALAARGTRLRTLLCSRQAVPRVTSEPQHPVPRNSAGYEALPSITASFVSIFGYRSLALSNCKVQYTS